MTGNRGLFNVLQESKGISVMLADGEKHVVEGIGSGRFTDVEDDGSPVDITLLDVIYVPKLTSG